MAQQVRISRLNDGRIGATLAGESGGFYAWSTKDALYVALAIMGFFEKEKQAAEAAVEEPDPDGPVDIT